MNKLLLHFLMAVFLIVSGCSVSVKHTPHETLNPLKDTAKEKSCLLVADVGDVRDNGLEDKDKIGFGVSYWLPVGYNLQDEQEKMLYASWFIADSILSDLKYLGYDARLLNPEVNSILTPELALEKARQSPCSYLITSKVYDAKTNYWGFIIIPFMQPVWTRIGLDLNIHDLKGNAQPVSLKVEDSETEWYFGKITIFDAIFDAGLFGKHWHRTAWGETVIPKGIASGVTRIHETINGKQTL